MDRTNNYTAVPNATLEEMAVNNVKLWNEVTYRRRQSFFKGKINWYSGDLEEKYKPLIGSVEAQQIVRKNNRAWKGFFKLLELQGRGKLPPHIQGRVHPPGYWKNKDGSFKRLLVVGRNDRYTIDVNPSRPGKPRDMKRGRGGVLTLKTIGKQEFRLKLKGKPRWMGKQGAVEIVYDFAFDRWRVHQAVRQAQLMERPKQRYEPQKPVLGRGSASDIGIVNLSATTFSEPDQPSLLYKGGYVLSDWVYWTKRIAEHQSVLKKTNGKHTSKRLLKLYAIRKRRMRHMVNAQIRDELEHARATGVTVHRIGDLKGLREDNDKGDKANQKVHNFFSYAYRARRYKLTGEEIGVKVVELPEGDTSKTCSLCGVKHRNGRKHRGLYHCKKFNVIENADVNGSNNILKVSPCPTKPLKRARAMTVRGSSREEGRSSRPVTRPTVPQCWNQSLNRWEPRITPPSGG